MSSQNNHISRMDGRLDVQELHGDLARKYRNVGSKVDAIWHNFTAKQREKAMRESIGNGQVLKHSRDRSLGVLCQYIPEYNLRDMTSRPEHFLNILKLRASTPLYNQLYEGANGMPGDRELIEETGMRHAQVPRDENTFFLEGKYYGQSFKSTVPGGELFPNLPVDASSVMIPRPKGELVLLRQQFLFQFLNHIIEDILTLGSETRNKAAPDKKTNEALVTAVSNLNVQPKPLKSSLPEVRAQAMESKAALEDHLFLLRTEPVVLNQAVRAAYSSRAELVPDDRGRILPALTDRHLSVAFFDCVTATVKAIAIWDYILRLLQLLDGATDKVKRGLVMQELSNTCHLEYRRAQECFKRNIAPPLHVAGRRFKRMTNNTSGQSKLVMKGQPTDSTVSDPQLHYVLRLCHPDTSPDAAVQWIQKLDDHNARYPEDRKKLSEAEVYALGDLAIIVSFMHMTGSAIAMTPVSRKSGLLFTSRSKELEVELDELKPKADFGDYLVPMGNLLEPNMATGALTALDDFVRQVTGARLGSLYEDTVQDSVMDLEKKCTEAQTRLEEAGKKTTYVPLPTETSSTDDARLAHRRAKEKTRPAESVYTITPSQETPQAATTEPSQQFKVKFMTASLFTAVFSKSEARGSVSWADFESVMVDLGFSVTPKGGSIFTFDPPASMETRPITLHRPHVSEIEGHKLLVLARRMQRVYGWTPDSFVVT